MKLALIAILGVVLASAAMAQGRTVSVLQFPYPGEPMYQYPVMDSRGEQRIRCPKGMKPYQGVCRKFRRVY